MSDKTYVCSKCLATAHHKGKCDMCKHPLILLNEYLDGVENAKNNNSK